MTSILKLREAFIYFWMYMNDICYNQKAQRKSLIYTLSDIHEYCTFQDINHLISLVQFESTKEVF